ncbi:MULTISPECIES: hypothetical protein [Pseudomonas]|jgi:regulator of replication initiation timing|uniref:Uncharacterized protein n=1 Tax=Pseudomonas marincola TaxID=437900 RepID=A0A1I7CZX1_9PSED|nr:MULTISPECIES: hypothetical protein [Pseudomonas]MAB98073.1 hypothetical protein [Pseudomonadaceae bacterium]NRH29793.1 hypothetical protein [Pseudomonas sp. MS19]OEO23881.1 hypothetical protein AX279_18690 [Pseudomonas sp. J237]CAE6903103.1 conserved protein of unknown function [Pseudomonas marincola]SFU04963.1 hypothetical protein SAMN05216264_109135 [Pseudomonas marincola]|tara:strand:- start:854 stop:1099 length:246 start_codon:yes stop_codon:yes gene_type:complete
MLENNLSQLEQLVGALLQENKTLQGSNATLTKELQTLKEENETLQLAALEQEELHGATAARIQALVELARAGQSAEAAPNQ